MDYGHIAAAVGFYVDRGYVYTEDAPWTVGREAYYATKPPGATDVKVLPDDTFMVASGEQSFLQMMLDGQPLKRAVCVTPCFRIERYNDWHKPYFMKAELINAHDVDEGHLVHMVHDACSFFERFLSVRVVQTDRRSYDIVEKGTRVELGSYGIRAVAHPDGRSKDIEWIYGTGCAEPRLSTAIQRASKVVGR